MGWKKTQKAKLNKKEKQMKKAHNELVKFLKLAFRRDKFKAHKELKKKQQAERVDRRMVYLKIFYFI